MVQLVEYTKFVMTFYGAEVKGHASVSLSHTVTLPLREVIHRAENTQRQASLPSQSEEVFMSFAYPLACGSDELYIYIYIDGHNKPCLEGVTFIAAHTPIYRHTHNCLFRPFSRD